MKALAYLDQAIKLLPKGRAWQVSADTWMGKLLLAHADGAARVDDRLLALLEECDPRTATEMIDAWEELVGLPDPCTGELTDLDDRRMAVWQKYTDRGGQSAAHFKEVAARLGYDVRIDEYDVMRCDGRAEDLVRDRAWKFAWTMVVRPTDEDTPDLGGFRNPGLECIVGRASPAHTTVLFDYPPLPEPTFWYNFVDGL